MALNWNDEFAALKYIKLLETVWTHIWKHCLFFLSMTPTFIITHKKHTAWYSSFLWYFTTAKRNTFGTWGTRQYLRYIISFFIWKCFWILTWNCTNHHLIRLPWSLVKRLFCSPLHTELYAMHTNALTIFGLSFCKRPSRENEMLDEDGASDRTWPVYSAI